MALRLVYFAWVRERMGRDGETIEPPAGVTTVAGLVDWLAGRDAEGADALADRSRLRAAVDGAMAGPDTPIAAAREVALFPPVTGG